MKRSTRIWIKIASVMMAAGIFLMIAGCAMGGIDIVRDWVENGELSWNFSLHGWEWNDSVRFNNRYPVYEGDVERTKIEGAEQIERLRFDAGGGLIEIKTSEDDGYWFSSENAKEYQCYVQDGSLELRVKGGSWVNNHSYDHVITVWLPKEESYREIDLDIGGGVLRMEALSGSEISVDVGAGRMEADALVGDRIDLDLGAGEMVVRSAEADRLTADVGAGEITIDTFTVRALDAGLGAGRITFTDGTVQDADISVSMGEIVYRGTITGDLDADCSMGQINLELTGAEEDHNYVIDCSMGEIRLGSQKFSGMGSSQTINNLAESDFDLDCSMGGIHVTFQQ